MNVIKNFKGVATGVALGCATVLGTGMAWAEETIKVGVLHSLSGTMAISETTLKDTVLMMIEEQNKTNKSQDEIIAKQQALIEALQLELEALKKQL